MITFREASENIMVMQGIITPEELTQRRKQRTDEIVWLRSSLAQDDYPAWLIAMVVAQWKYQQS